MPLVSIIMPVYNKEKYVRKSIQSILDQTFTDFELIIVNDGSTDHSLEICESFHDSRITIISVTNGGVSKARNIGLDNAKGEYITFIDSDDYVDYLYLEKLYVKDEDMIIGGITKVNTQYQKIETLLPQLSGSVFIKDLAHTFYQEQIDTGIYGFIASKIVRRKIIEDNHIRFDTKIKLAEDYDFFLKIYSQIDSLFFTSECLYYYVQETNNSAISMEDDQIDFIEQIKLQEKTKNFLVSNDAFKEKEKNLYLHRINGYVYTILIQDKYRHYMDFKQIFNILKKSVHVVDRKETGLMKICLWLYQRYMIAPCYILISLKRMIRRIL